MLKTKKPKLTVITSPRTDDGFDRLHAIASDAERLGERDDDEPGYDPVVRRHNTCPHPRKGPALAQVAFSSAAARS